MTTRPDGDFLAYKISKLIEDYTKQYPMTPIDVLGNLEYVKFEIFYQMNLDYPKTEEK